MVSEQRTTNDCVERVTSHVLAPNVDPGVLGGVLKRLEAQSQKKKC